MEETDLIGIENPETGEIGFISVMGSIGEYESVAVYLGAEGFYGFIDFVEDNSATADRLLSFLICKRPSRNESISRSKIAI